LPQEFTNYLHAIILIFIIIYESFLLDLRSVAQFFFLFIVQLISDIPCLLSVKSPVRFILSEDYMEALDALPKLA
jgi:hypothetical protein